jgi:hypothetical protein
VEYVGEFPSRNVTSRKGEVQGPEMKPCSVAKRLVGSGRPNLEVCLGRHSTDQDYWPGPVFPGPALDTQTKSGTYALRPAGTHVIFKNALTVHRATRGSRSQGTYRWLCLPKVSAVLTAPDLTQAAVVGPANGEVSCSGHRNKRPPGGDPEAFSFSEDVS